MTDNKLSLKHPVRQRISKAVKNLLDCAQDRSERYTLNTFLSDATLLLPDIKIQKEDEYIFFLHKEGYVKFVIPQILRE